MSTLLVKNAALLVTMDEARRERSNGGLFVRDGFIEQIGATDDLPPAADTVLDLRGCLVLPGLVNTHHHFYQTLTRNLPAVQDAKLFDWLLYLYEVWKGIDEEAVRMIAYQRSYQASARYIAALSELFDILVNL